MKTNIKSVINIGFLGILIFVLAACSTHYKPVLTSKQGVNFQVTTLEKGKQIARAQNKPLFVFAHASWCATCKKMEQEVFIQEQLGKVYNQEFVNVAIDVDSPEGKRLNGFSKISGTPTLFFFGMDGNVLYKSAGFESADELLAIAARLKN
jgi:thioredoxin 1